MTAPAAVPARPPDHPGLLAAVRCLALDSLAAATADVLADAGIRCVLLKGPATAARLLGDRRDQRSYSDVDLLVAPDRFADAQEALADHGYQPRLAGLRQSEQSWHERPWRAPSADLTVDLHRGCAGVQDPTAFWTAVWAGRENLDVGGGVLAVPGPAAAALILALHATTPGSSRKPLDDLARARAVLPPAVWAAAVTLARQVDAAPAFRTGIELLPSGAAIADQLGLARTGGLSGRLTARQASPLSVSAATLLDLPSRWQMVRYAGRKLFPSPALVRLREDGVGPGRSALARGYLRRWARAATGAWTAVVELEDARRPDNKVGRRRRSAVRIAAAGRIASSPDAVRTLLWSLRMIRQVRQEVPERPFGDILLAGPPGSDRSCRSAMNAGLRLRRASCLEQSLLRQRFDAANGVRRTLIIGVTKPGNGFRAHSWLDGDPQRDSSMRELLRQPAPSQLFADPRSCHHHPPSRDARAAEQDLP